jgi:DNA-directed RNA polymerase specialized sigma subunit
VYLKNKELVEQIIFSKEQDKLTPEAEKMLILLANKTIGKMRYNNPDDKEDCLQSGLLVLFSNWRGFDPEKSTNAFAYYTEIFKRGISYGYGVLNYMKGDSKRVAKKISIHTSNDGEGMYNF